MKAIQYSFTLLVFFVCSIISAETEQIKAGFGGEGGENHLMNFTRNGMNAQFWCVRIAPQMLLKVDSKGQVVAAEIDSGKKQEYINRAQIAQRQGIDLYLTTGFFKEYVTQLSKLGPYTKAFVQGPTRYISPGEKSAPGPLEERYWLGQLLCEVKFAAELSKIVPSIKGFLIDFEMYGGDMMWRWNSSFDDQTFKTVMKEMRKKQLLGSNINPESVAKADRYQLLKDNYLLDDYFSIEEMLVSNIARRLREEINAINPDFKVGFLPYESNWFYDGWAQGLNSDRVPVLICSEAEYHTGLTPNTLARIARLKKMGINFRYIPGLMIGSYSPKQLGIQVKRCLEAADGYWFFTTYSLWQPEPEKLWGPYLIQAPAYQYWGELAKANTPEFPISSDETYKTPGYVLLTNNEYYPEPKLALPLKVVYNIPPDVVFYDDPENTKLFNGSVNDAYGTVAWHAATDKELYVVIDFSKTFLIERLLLVAGHILPNFPSVVDGSLEIMSSIDGKMYYPISKETLLAGRGKTTPDMDYNNLGIKARFIKVTMKAEKVSKHSVWTISELAVWGTP